MEEADILISLVEEINSYKYINFSNDMKKKKKQSAVAIILRVEPHLEKLLNLANFQDKLRDKSCPIPSQKQLQSIFSNFIGKTFHKGIFQVLFVQRSFSEKDLHSGEICFPGGKCDNDETDFEAVIREVKEEVDFDLSKNENSIYLGKFPRNFYVYYTRHGVLNVSIHLFLLTNYEKVAKNSQFNVSEISQIKWIALQNLLQPPQDMLVLKKIQAKKTWIQNYPKIIQSIFQKMIKNYEHSEYAGLDIGFSETLYGLTFFMVIYMLWIVNEVWIEKKGGDKKNLMALLKFSNYSQMIFKKQGFIEKFGGWFANRWYKKHRVDQFRYQRNKEKNKESRGVILFCFVIIVFIIFLFCFK